MTCHICEGRMEWCGPFGPVEYLKCKNCFAVRNAVPPDVGGVIKDLSPEEAEVFELVREESKR